VNGKPDRRGLALRLLIGGALAGAAVLVATRTLGDGNGGSRREAEEELAPER
jgi:hypothetical protein